MNYKRREREKRTDVSVTFLAQTCVSVRSGRWCQDINRKRTIPPTERTFTNVIGVVVPSISNKRALVHAGMEIVAIFSKTPQLLADVSPVSCSRKPPETLVCGRCPSTK